VDVGSGQGRSEFETAGVDCYVKGFNLSEKTGLGQKMLLLDGY
jgi:hypothetical protein